MLLQVAPSRDDVEILEAAVEDFEDDDLLLGQSLDHSHHTQLTDRDIVEVDDELGSTEAAITNSIDSLVAQI